LSDCPSLRARADEFELDRLQVDAAAVDFIGNRHRTDASDGFGIEAASRDASSDRRV
jgi:hypothetical protein